MLQRGAGQGSLRGRIRGRCQPIHPPRVAGEDGGLFGFGQVLQRFPQREEPARPAAGQLDDRPVAAEEQAFGAEDFERVIQVGPEIGGPPAGVVRFGHQAAEFADHIGPGGQGAHTGAPAAVGIGRAWGSDGGFGTVIEDELDVRAALYELAGFFDLMPADAEVMCEAEIGQRAQAAGERGLLGEAGRLLLVIAADADDRWSDDRRAPRVAAQLGQEGEAGADGRPQLQRGVGDDAEDGGRGFRSGFRPQAGDPFRFGEALGGAAAGFYEDEPTQLQAGFAGGSALQLVFDGAVGSGDSRHGGQPIVLQAGGGPEMDVTIDEVHGSGSWGWNGASSHGDIR